ncbi:hypothetical protein [Dactylosporangium sp. CS-033363]|uniref:hypothetical protein n=1 Tax=Dactylosporangium sp. CS-033363 TaxID=3239935 RepID=UPI003D925627
MSAVVLSATLLASGSAGASAPSAGPARPPVASTASPASPLFAADASLVVEAPVYGWAALADAPAPPAPPRPVAGLDQTQMNNAIAIVKQGRAQGVPEKGLVVAVATAMQESDLYNVASPAVPSSLKLPHDAVSTDHDSVGLFQQRASQGWGSVPELMDPAHSAMLFYNALAQIRGWQSMSVTGAAQAVQRSAYPSAYQKHADRAAQVVAAIA